ncbi:hypothetical protein [Streptomyces sp. G-G2]|uniref:hypothetical protein n=1 Tax=Streptomyces sp. G-G2 TaxID=3046201 RepID=UPI0024B8A8DA|nr:hypothetical protein [Streptomyces sp. G-G2]MDJ0382229.1 hypothetical protein [Streptomyces sp. G-G2]
MKRLELVIVQFEEVKRLIEVGRVPQLRLAHILLDSAVELIMHRMAEAELRFEHIDFDRLENLRRLESMRKSDNPLHRRFATGPSDDQLRAEIQRLEGGDLEEEAEADQRQLRGQSRLPGREGEAS